MSSDTPRTIRLVLEYDGTAYGGWQRQANAPSIQQTLEEAVRQITQEPELRIRGASRTDAGVHALGQVASFVTQSRVPVRGLFRGLNTMLPRDIGVRACDEVDASFNARLSATGKHYRYRILNRPAPSPMRSRFVWHLPWPTLDTSPMVAAQHHLSGRHDFAAFRAADCERTSTIRELTRVEVSRCDDEIHVDVEGTAFLKYMVRVLVGTLVGAGRGLFSPDDVLNIRERGERRAAGVTAPPEGLCLMEVFYHQDEAGQFRSPVAKTAATESTMSAEDNFDDD